MKKLILSLVMLTVFSSAIFAQDDAKKSLKKAAKALSAYNLDNTAADKLMEAAAAADMAVKGAELGKTAKPWLTRGEIYNAIVNKEFLELTKNPEYKLQNLDAGLKAFESYKSVLGLEAKKFETKEAINQLGTVGGSMTNAGVTLFRAGDYENAFANFSAVLEADELVVANGGKTRFVVEEDGFNPKDEAKYLAGIAAEQIGKKEVAMKYYKELIDAKYNNASIYSGMYKMTKDADIDAAMGYLDAGIAAFPEDNGLLFDKINYFLENDKKEDLIASLKAAIEKEPENVSLYNVMANTYDKLSQDANAAGDAAQGQTYFENALDYFGAALITQEIKDLEEKGFSNAILKQIATKEEGMKELFGKAMPFFEKSYSQNPTDRNTIIALKEIYARTGNLDKSQEMKKALDAVSKGE